MPDCQRRHVCLQGRVQKFGLPLEITPETMGTPAGHAIHHGNSVDSLFNLINNHRLIFSLQQHLENQLGDVLVMVDQAQDTYAPVTYMEDLPSVSSTGEHHPPAQRPVRQPRSRISFGAGAPGVQQASQVQQRRPAPMHGSGGPQLRVLLEDDDETPVEQQQQHQRRHVSQQPQHRPVQPRQQRHRFEHPRNSPRDPEYYEPTPPRVQPRQEHLFVDQAPAVHLEVLCPSDDYEEIW